MLKKLMVASLAVGALALGAPVASAEPTSFDCGFNAIAQQTVTGGQDTFTGVAYGYVVGSAPTNTVTIQCWIRVDNTRITGAGETPVGTGTGTATTAGQVTYTATDTQDVDLCADWTDGGTSGTVCFESTSIQIPPQEVIDLLLAIFDTLEPIFAEIDRIIFEVTSIPDATICPILVEHADTADVPGVFEIKSDGDVYIAGEWFWDCMPYGTSGT